MQDECFPVPAVNFVNTISILVLNFTKSERKTNSIDVVTARLADSLGNEMR